MNDSNTLSPLEVALPVILELHAKGNTSRYIARALDIRRIPTITGRGAGWDAKAVWRIVQKHAPKAPR